VVIWAGNAVRWVIADLAIMTCGAVTVPVYSSSTAAQAEHIWRDSGAKLLFVDTPRLQALAHWSVAELPPIIVHEPIRGPLPQGAGTAFDWEQALDFTPTTSGLVSRLEAHQPADLATIIYTSGTSGVPKGVMLDHQAFEDACDDLLEIYTASHEDVLLSYLPLAHAIERLLVVFLATRVGATTHFADSVEKMPSLLPMAQPTVFIGVPRVWEKFVEGIERKLDQSSLLKRALFALAVRVGRSVAKAKEAGREPGPVMARLHALFSRRVYVPIREALGLKRARYLLSGGAPLRRDVMDFLGSLGLPVLEVYGQTETLVTSVNRPSRYRCGSVGSPVARVSIRLADDGEVQVKGKHLFRGYWQKDDETKDSFTSDGWMGTGDVGTFDEHGFLHITGRKKALLVTAGGKKVAPEPLEARLCAIPGVSQAIVIGEGRKYLTALLTLTTERHFSEESGPDQTADEQIVKPVREEIAVVNAALAPFEQIKKFAVLRTPFSVETGELTATMKVRREVVEKNRRKVIDSLYGGT
jgi:long-chain acyl-CoA synthetase